MAITTAEMRALVGRLHEAVAATKSRYPDREPKPHPPATEAQLAKFEQHLGVRLPESYRTFLLLHDGYEWLAFSGHLLSIADRMPGSACHARISAWRDDCARYGNLRAASGIVIADAENPNDYTWFDPFSDGPDGEWKVVRGCGGEEVAFADFPAFLEQRIRLCEAALRRQP